MLEWLNSTLETRNVFHQYKNSKYKLNKRGWQPRIYQREQDIIKDFLEYLWKKGTNSGKQDSTN